MTPGPPSSSRPEPILPHTTRFRAERGRRKLAARQDGAVPRGGIGEFVPRAHREAIVAAIDAIADRVPELFGDRPRMFDREIGDAAPGIEPVRRGKGLRRTRILTRPATAAVIAPRRAWHEVESRIDRAEEQPAAMRTEERSIGKECVSTWRSRRGRYT